MSVFYSTVAPSQDAASTALERFAEKWDAKYPAISKSWRGDFIPKGAKGIICVYLTFKPKHSCFQA